MANKWYLNHVKFAYVNSSCWISIRMKALSNYVSTIYLPYLEIRIKHNSRSYKRYIINKVAT